jgi:GR25 family glycosyltransferase involved in LPS biosynthesis
VKFQTYVLGVRTNFRGEALVENLKALGIQPEIVWGPEAQIDSELLSSHTNQEYCSFTINRDIKKQEVACCMGHLRMYQRFIESETEWGFFLEDDAILVLDPSLLIRQLPTTKQPLHIFINDGPGTDLKHWRGSHTGLLRLDLVRKLDPQYGAYGYLLNRAAIREIMSAKIDSYINTPDWPYLWPQKMHFYHSKTIYVSHPSDTSMSIIGERLNEASRFVSLIPNPIRVMRGKQLGISLKFLIYKEIYLKSVRITLQVFKRISNDHDS